MSAEALTALGGLLALIGSGLGWVIKRLVLDRIVLLEGKISRLEARSRADHLLISHHSTFRFTVTSLARQDATVDSSLIIQLDDELNDKLRQAQRLEDANRKKKDRP